MALLGPWSVGYKVNFKSKADGGDTTSDAFGKHIQEIERIYGILNALDVGKVSADDVNTAITNAITNLKNTWKPTNLTFNDITGNVAASRVVGDLTNATIDKGRVTGLEALIQSKIPVPVDKGDGITNSNLSQGGFVRFTNGFEIKWGQTTSFSKSSLTSGNRPDKNGTVTFGKAFTTCFAVTIAPHFTNAQDYSDYFFQLLSYSNTGFSWRLQTGADADGWKPFDNAYITWIAIGFSNS